MDKVNWKILLCDDNKHDRALIKRQLKKEFKNIEVAEAGTPNSFKNNLQAADFELAIVDYKLNWTTGLDLVKQLKEVLPECPIIMFTATGSEEIAVKAMKSGVDDYIIKSLDNFVPLLVAVKTAMRAHREKIDYEQSLITKEQNYHRIFETAANLIISVDKNGYILDCNQRVKKFLGYEKSELIGQNMTKIIHPDYHKAAQKNLKLVIKQGVLYNEKYKMVRQEGTEIVVSINSSVLADSTGKFSRTIFLIEDITSEANNQKRLLHLHNVLASIRNVNQLITHEKNAQHLIEKACKTLIESNGYHNAWIALLNEKEELITTAEAGVGKKIRALEKLLRKGDIPKTIQKVLKQNSIVVTSDPSIECMDCPLSQTYTESGSFSVRLIHNKKVYGVMSVSVPYQFVYDKREQELFLEAANDIAFALYSIEIEKKRAETDRELKRSENMLQRIMQTMPGGFVLIDKDYRIHQVNQQTCKTTGFSQEELEGALCDIICPKGSKSKLCPIWEEEKDGFFNMDTFVKCKDGSKIPILKNAKKIKLDGQEFIIENFQTTTDLKNAKKELEHSRENLRATLNSIGDAVISTDTKGVVTALNPVAESLTGYSKQEAIGQKLEDVFQIINADTRKKVASPAVRALREGKIIGLANHTILVAKDATEYQIADSAAPIQNSAGDIIGVVLVFRDVTKQYEMQQKLANSEKHFRELFNSMTEGVCEHELVFDDKGKVVNYRITNANPAYEKHLQIKPQDVVGKLATKAYNTQEPPYLEEYKNVALTNKPLFFETYFEEMDKYFQISVFSPGKNKFATIFTDITTRKINEQKIKENENKFRTLVDQAAEMLFLHDTEGNIVEVNKAAVKNSGYSKDELLHMQVFDLDPEAGRRGDKEEIWQKIVDSDEPITIEVNHKRKDGSIYQAIVSISKVILKEQEYILALAHNISKRVQAEEARHKSDERFRIAQEMSPDGFTILHPIRDEQGDVIDFSWIYENKAIAKLNGTDPEEIVGKRLLELFPGHRETQFLKAYKKVAETGKPITFDQTYYAKNITKKTWFRIVVVPMAENIAVLAQDITERKKAEIEACRNKETLQKYIQKAPFGIFITNQKGEYIDCNLAASKIMGYSKKEILNMSISDILPESGLKLGKQHFDKVKAEGFSDGETDFIHKNGTIRKIQVTAVKISDDSFMGFVQDITDRKKAERELKRIEWLLEKEEATDEKEYAPSYGDVTKLNTERTILENVGKPILQLFAEDLMNLLDTSVSIYEKNGDYAFGMFQSGWCRLMDNASRQLCHTDNNQEALSCGKWLCHENCWNNSAKTAMKSKAPTDINCIGGIKLYAEPIIANNQVIGAINIGYGNPPTDEASLQKLAERYKVDIATLKKAAKEYKTRPHFIIEAAKKRLRSVATMLGIIVESKQNANKIKQKNKELQTFNDIAVERELVVNNLRREVNKLLEQLGQKEKYDVVE